MPLASSGPWLSIGRQASQVLSHGGPLNIASATKHQARGIHIPHTAHTEPSTAQRFLRSTKGLLQAFVGHLTTPGTLNGRISSSASRGLYGAFKPQTIQQSFTPGMRYALSRPMGAPSLPRAPAVPRGIAQVGLGTARNFSTGRPIFQNLVQNVPIAGRAAYEVDWDISGKMKEDRKLALGKEQKKTRKASAIAQVEQVHFYSTTASATPATPTPEVESKEELDHYFSAPAAPAVTTQLLIPLAPTPSARLPLPSNPPSTSVTHPFLPLDVLGRLHTDHTMHSLRVSTLFARLDVAHVWERGAVCDVYGSYRGEASVLRVRFEGWTVNEVRAVIGESGKGWCVLEEEISAEEAAKEMEEVEDALSAMDLDSGNVSVSDLELDRSPFEDDGYSTTSIDPAQSFVLPTLDFSASFPLSTSSSQLVSPAATPSANERTFDFFSDSNSDSFSDTGSMSDGSGGMEFPIVDPPSLSLSRASSSSWVGFSSTFSERMGEGPREELF